MTEITLNNIVIRFPFEPYDVQKDYMTKVIQCLQNGENGVLESPTGTGKTLCLLCSSLAWIETKKADQRARQINDPDANDKGPLSSLSAQLSAGVGNIWGKSSVCPKIIYSSRTHAQLSQVINELKRTSYSYMKNAILGSRDQMCIHPEVSKEENNNNKVHMCQIRVKSRNCYFHNQVEGKKDEPDLKKILDLEDLVKIGRKKTFCPYYMAREIRQDADIIFLPYNYLLDPKSRKAHGIELQGNIIIFDEAHNVEKICEESASLQLRSTDVALCIEEVTQVMKKMQESTDSGFGSTESTAGMPEDFSPEDLCILKTILLELEKAIDEIAPPKDDSGTAYPGSFMFDLLEKADISFQKKGVILELLDKIILYLTTSSNSPFQRKGAGLQKFSDLIKIVYSKDSFSLDYVNLVKQCYKVHVGIEEKTKNFNNKNAGWGAQKMNSLSAKSAKVISYWCFSPGFGMKELLEQGVQCVILTSGTLSPMDSFTSELQIPLPIKLENPHIINPCQVWVGAICKGPDGHELNSSFRTRETPEYKSSLGLTILTFSRVIPGGLLVFFPSYPILLKCQEHWQNNGIWERLSLIKPVFVESQSKDGFHTAMEEFYAKVRDPALKGACFMAVCRGKVSEGLDFANRNGRAVIITGLPFPPFKDPRVILKRKYLDELRQKNKVGLSGANWYKLEASRAVNQAIGRIIRHKDDYGAIILCDKRFGEFGFTNELSSWVRPRMKVFPTFGPALREVIQFFRAVQPMFPETDASEHKKRVVPSYEESSKAVSVKANAFECGLTRPAFSQAKRVREGSSLPQKSDSKEDPILNYSTIPFNQSSNTNSHSKDLSLFSALDHKSSLLNFNRGFESKLSEAKGCPPNLIPKKKKIKLISQSERSIKDFLKTSLELQNAPMHRVTVGVASNESDKEQAAIIKKKKITTYLEEVKSKLSIEEYKRFSAIIRANRQSQSRDMQLLTKDIKNLFASCDGCLHLLQKFSVFLNMDQRSHFEAMCEQLLK